MKLILIPCFLTRLCLLHLMTVAIVGRGREAIGFRVRVGTKISTSSDSSALLIHHPIPPDSALARPPGTHKVILALAMIQDVTGSPIFLAACRLSVAISPYKSIISHIISPRLASLNVPCYLVEGLWKDLILLS